jgi:hypothetical protein
MTDVMGRTPKVGDRLAMAFENGSHGTLRVGVVQSFDDTGPWLRVEMLWEASSSGWLPQSPITKVQLRDYVIVS